MEGEERIERKKVKNRERHEIKRGQKNKQQHQDKSEEVQ